MKYENLKTGTPVRTGTLTIIPLVYRCLDVYELGHKQSGSMVGYFTQELAGFLYRDRSNRVRILARKKERKRIEEWLKSLTSSGDN